MGWKPPGQVSRTPQFLEPVQKMRCEILNRHLVCPETPLRSEYKEEGSNGMKRKWRGRSPFDMIRIDAGIC